MRLTDDAGQEYNGFAVPFRRKINTEFAMIFQGAWRRVADMPLTPTAYRVLNYLLSQLEYGNIVEESQTHIAASLDIDRSRVSEAFKQLRLHGVLVQLDTPRGRRHMFDPFLAHRGNAPALEEAQQKWKQAAQRSIVEP